MLPAGNNGTRGEALLFHRPATTWEKREWRVRLSYLARISMIVMGITKPCTELHPAPSTSTQHHPAPSTSTQHISISTQLHPPQLSWFQPPPSSLQHPYQYSNQNTASNWAIFPNLGRKIQSCLFSLKIGTHSFLEVLIPNPDLDFWNSDPKIHFWATCGPKSQSCLFCQKIGTHGISWMLIFIPTLVFWISNPKFLFGQIWAICVNFFACEKLQFFYQN